MSEPSIKFQSRKSIEQVEEGVDLAPKFDDRGLITAVTTDANSGELLMQGYMNAEARSRPVKRTITAGVGKRSGIKAPPAGSCKRSCSSWWTTTRTASGCGLT